MVAGGFVSGNLALWPVGCCRLVKLPKAVQASHDMLEAAKAGGHGKASALKKKHKSSEIAIGPVMEVDVTHADGQPLRLQLQVCLHVLLRDGIDACPVAGVHCP